MQSGKIFRSDMRQQPQSDDHCLPEEPQREFFRYIFRKQPYTERRKDILDDSHRRKPCLAEDSPQQGEEKRVQRFPVYMHINILAGIIVYARPENGKHPEEQHGEYEKKSAGSHLFCHYSLQYKYSFS